MVPLQISCALGAATASLPIHLLCLSKSPDLVASGLRLNLNKQRLSSSGAHDKGKDFTTLKSTKAKITATLSIDHDSKTYSDKSHEAGDVPMPVLATLTVDITETDSTNSDSSTVKGTIPKFHESDWTELWREFFEESTLVESIPENMSGGKPEECAVSKI